MRLSKFIRTNLDIIVGEWESYARTMQPAADAMDIEGLRDHARRMLRVIANEMEATQTVEQRRSESRSGDSQRPASSDSEAASHGADRRAAGFTPEHPSFERCEPL